VQETTNQYLNNKEQSVSKIKNPSVPNVRVIKWYDYSTKYGLGYVLSNGATGVFFNDGAKFVSQSER